MSEAKNKLGPPPRVLKDSLLVCLLKKIWMEYLMGGFNIYYFRTYNSFDTCVYSFPKVSGRNEFQETRSLLLYYLFGSTSVYPCFSFWKGFEECEDRYGVI